MNGDATVVLTITRTELGMITDALELMEDAEHLRPWRQDLAAALREKVEKMAAPCDQPSRYRYQIGCRCPGCIAENTEYSRIWRSNSDRRWRSYAGHAAPDFLWTILLLLFILVLLRMLGAV